MSKIKNELVNGEGVPKYQTFLKPLVGTELELAAYKIADTSNKGFSEIKNFFEGSLILDDLYSFLGRTKSASKILSKVHRKRNATDKPKPEYNPHNVTDIIGIRFVTLFREDLSEIVAEVLNVLKGTGDYGSSSPFIKGYIPEIIVYHDSRHSDPVKVTNLIEDTIKTAGYEPDLQKSDAGYSSVHMLTGVRVLENGQYNYIPVEIQIRTVFEDAWGEIDHKLKYEIKNAEMQDGMAGSKKMAELKNAFDHIAVMKSFVDGCNQYADIIKHMIYPPKNMLGDTFSDVQGEDIILDGDGDGDLGTLAKFKETLKAQDDKQTLSKSDYVDIADQLEKLLFEIESKDNPDVSVVMDYKMEIAYCLLNAGDKKHHLKALEYYIYLKDEKKDEPILFYRTGQIYNKIGQIQNSISNIEKCIELLDGKESGFKHYWLNIAARKALGFQNWSEANKISPDDNPKHINYLIKAYKITAECLRPEYQSIVQKHTAVAGLVNNCLSYLVQILKLNYVKDDDDLNVEEANKLEKTLWGIMSLLSETDYNSTWIYRFETLFQYYNYVGDEKRIKSVAEVIFKYACSLLPSSIDTQKVLTDLKLEKDVYANLVKYVPSPISNIVDIALEHLGIDYSN